MMTSWMDDYATQSPQDGFLQRTAQLGSTLIVFLLIVLGGWSLFAKVDVVATTTGKLIPSGRTRIIQAPSYATIKKMEVKEGDFVREGAVLIRLDSQITRARNQKAKKELALAELDEMRLFAAFKETPVDEVEFQTSTAPEVLAAQRYLFSAQREAQLAELKSIQSRINNRESSIKTLHAEMDRDRNVLELTQEKLYSTETLESKGFVTRSELLDIRLETANLSGNLNVYINRIEERVRQVDELQSLYRQRKMEQKSSIATELLDVKRKQISLLAEIEETDETIASYMITAPFDGTVQELKAVTLGNVVEEAERLMSIVPKNERIELEAYILGRDIGFVSEGQEVAVKFESFAFTRYGSLKGEILSISSDSVSVIEDGIPVNLSTDVDRMKILADFGGPGRGSYYLARIRLSDSTMQVDGRRVTLVPGMVSVVDIKIGQKRVFDFVVSPLLRHISESLREL